MKKKFENITVIDNKELFDAMATYEENLIHEATANGSLANPDADNEYTREIARIGTICANYESNYMTFKCLKFKSPLVLGIEKDMWQILQHV
ncbi:hypothetical protein AGMMS50239_32900 [Bacteroidia bacterium]|nr:hypothetical protein AGMMS50239_32900 [Bacteroidia bacterium]